MNNPPCSVKSVSSMVAILHFCEQSYIDVSSEPCVCCKNDDKKPCFTFALPNTLIFFLDFSYYPQFHRHLTCGTPENNQCFSNQGICSKTVQNTHILILHPIEPTIVNEVHLGFTTCCTCEIVAGNLFDAFV